MFEGFERCSNELKVSQRVQQHYTILHLIPNCPNKPEMASRTQDTAYSSQGEEEFMTIMSSFPKDSSAHAPHGVLRPAEAGFAPKRA